MTEEMDDADAEIEGRGWGGAGNVRMVSTFFGLGRWLFAVESLLLCAGC